MVTDVNDPMVLENDLAARALEKQEALLRNGVSENSVLNGAMEVTEQGEGTAVASKKQRRNWTQEETDDLLRAVSITPKACTRMEQGTASGSYWDVVGAVVPGRTGDECRGRMGTLQKTKKYCDEQGKQFKQLNRNDFAKIKVSPQLTEAWYNQIRDYCPPKPKKKLKTNGARQPALVAKREAKNLEENKTEAKSTSTQGR